MEDSSAVIDSGNLGHKQFTIAIVACGFKFRHIFADLFLAGGKVNQACGTEESNPIYFFMQTNLFHHLVNPRAIILQHLEMRRMQDDLTDGFDVILGIQQKNFLESGNIEIGKQGDCDQQHNTGSEGELADQALT
jgi:hypothetical protein